MNLISDKNPKAPPLLVVCHSFSKVQKNDFNLTPSHLFVQCHSFTRFIFLKASLIQLFSLISKTFFRMLAVSLLTLVPAF